MSLLCLTTKTHEHEKWNSQWLTRRKKLLALLASLRLRGTTSQLENCSFGVTDKSQRHCWAEWSLRSLEGRIANKPQIDPYSFHNREYYLSSTVWRQSVKALRSALCWLKHWQYLEALWDRTWEELSLDGDVERLQDKEVEPPPSFDGVSLDAEWDLEMFNYIYNMAYSTMDAILASNPAAQGSILSIPKIAFRRFRKSWV